jgi:signal peptidase I
MRSGQYCAAGSEDPVSGPSKVTQRTIQSRSGITVRQSSPVERVELEPFSFGRNQEGEGEMCEECLSRSSSSHRSGEGAFGSLRNSGFLMMFCRGSSMAPTINEGNVLFVRPYEGRSIRCGDVVVFRSISRTLPVVHRVLNQGARGIRTMGDNNDRVDSDLLDPGDIAGQVVYAQRANRLRRVHGGNLGWLIGGAMRLRRIVHRRLCNAFHPMYDWLARSGIFRPRSGFRIRTRVVCFRRNEENQFMLLWGTTPIGRFVPEFGAWALKPPFRLFVDELSLPKPG